MRGASNIIWVGLAIPAVIAVALPGFPVPASTPDICASACATEPLCRGYSYLHPGCGPGDGFRCVLHASSSSLLPCAEFLSKPSLSQQDRTIVRPVSTGPSSSFIITSTFVSATFDVNGLTALAIDGAPNISVLTDSWAAALDGNSLNSTTLAPPTISQLDSETIVYSFTAQLPSSAF